MALSYRKTDVGTFTAIEKADLVAGSIHAPKILSANGQAFESQDILFWDIHIPAVSSVRFSDDINITRIKSSNTQRKPKKTQNIHTT